MGNYIFKYFAVKWLDLKFLLNNLPYAFAA